MYADFNKIQDSRREYVITDKWPFILQLLNDDRIIYYVYICIYYVYYITGKV